MKASSEKSTTTTPSPATQTSSQPFFAKAGGGDFFEPARQTAPPAVQMKLTVNKPGDSFEQEADKTADKVMRMPAPTSAPAITGKDEKLQRQPDDKLQKAALPEEKIQKAELKDDKIQKAPAQEEKLQKKEDDKLQKAPAQDDKIQKKESPQAGKTTGDGTPAVTSDVQTAIRQQTSGGQPLSNDVRTFMEPRFGADFSNVRIHTNAESAGLSNQLSARAFTYQNHIFFSRDQYQPGTSAGKQLLAHELTHTVQQGHAVQRSPQVATTATPPPVQRLGVQDALDYFADKAYNIPGFRMLTIVLGFNPINMRSTDRSAANILRALVELVPGGHLITQALDNHGVFAKAGAWIEQKLAILGNIGSEIISGLKSFINSLSWTDIFDLGGVWDRAKRIFTDPIGRLIAFAGSVVSELLKMVKDAILKPLAALAEGTRGYDLLKALLGVDPITGEAVPRTADTLIGGFMKLIGQEEIWENIKKGNAVARAWAWFQGALGGLLSFARTIPRRIIDTLTSLTFQDILSVAGAFSKIVGSFASIAGEFFNWALNQVISLLEILFSVVAPGVMPYIAKAKAAFHTILKNPIGFVNNLVRAGKMGFQLFASNIGEHLKTALIKWITGPLGEAGVYIPKSFSLIEIVKLVLSVLGLTWQNIRSKLVKIIPEPVLVVLEKTAGILVTLVKDGPAAAWEQIKTELTELKDQMISQVTQMITTEVVKAAVAKLVSMINPAGAVIQAILAIYNTVTFFIQKINQIAAVVASFIDSISAIASGQVEGAAKKVEQTMASTLTVIIAFLAKFAGLGNIPDKLVGIVKKIRQPIDKGLDKIVAWLGNLLKKLGGKADSRTEKEKERDVKLAKADAQALLDRTPLVIDEVQAKLPAIKNKYKLTRIDIESLGNEEYDIVIEINPKDKTAKKKATKKDDPPGSIPPIERFKHRSSDKNIYDACRDSTKKAWFWVQSRKFWQLLPDNSKLLAAEKAADTWLVANKPEFESLINADKRLMDPGFDQFGLQSSTKEGDRLHIGDTKGGFGAHDQYFGYKNQQKQKERDNPFSATTDNLITNIERQRTALNKSGDIDKVKKIDTLLKSGQVTVTYFLAGKAQISDATEGKVRGIIKVKLIGLLTKEPYNLTKEDASTVVSNVVVTRQRI